MIPSLAEQSITFLFTNMIERGRGMLNFKSCKNSFILLQIEVFKYIIRLHSVVFYPNLELCKWNEICQSCNQCRMNMVQSVPEEHFLLTALLSACFQWKLSPTKQDSVSWTTSYWYKLLSIALCWIIVTRTHLTLRILLLNHSIWIQIWMPS